MRNLVKILLWVGLSGCATIKPEPRTGTIPDIPVEKRDCNSPLGVIPDGQTATGYLNAFEEGGRTCQKGVLTCFDGEWSGEYVHPYCEEVPTAP